MEKTLVLVILMLALEHIICIVVGVCIYLRGLKKGIMLCEMVNTDGASATEFYGQPREVAEHSLIEDDSDDRKEEQDEE